MGAAQPTAASDNSRRGNSSTNKEKDLRHNQHMVWAPTRLQYSTYQHVGTFTHTHTHIHPALTTSVRSHNNHRTSNGREGGGRRGEGSSLFGRGVCGLSVCVSCVASVCSFLWSKRLVGAGALSLPGLKSGTPFENGLQMGCPLPEWDPRCKITIIGMHS